MKLSNPKLLQRLTDLVGLRGATPAVRVADIINPIISLDASQSPTDASGGTLVDPAAVVLSPPSSTVVIRVICDVQVGTAKKIIIPIGSVFWITCPFMTSINGAVFSALEFVLRTDAANVDQATLMSGAMINNTIPVHGAVGVVFRAQVQLSIIQIARVLPGLAGQHFYGFNLHLSSPAV